MVVSQLASINDVGYYMTVVLFALQLLRCCCQT